MLPYDTHDLAVQRGRDLRRGAAHRRAARPGAGRRRTLTAPTVWRPALGRQLIRWGLRLVRPTPASGLRTTRR